MANYKQFLKDVTTFIFDYDGVMNDGNVILLSSEDEPLRTVNVKDGYALQLAVKKGYNVAIISGGKSDVIKERFKRLGIKDIFLGAEHKLTVYKEYIDINKIDSKNVLYMGDDIPDYEVMLEVGMPVCPADAAEEIKSISKYISPEKGGHGCVRDIIEQVLKVQDNWLKEGDFHW